MALSGSGLQVKLTIDGAVKALNQDGTLTTGGGYQFSSPSDAVAALAIACSNESGTLTKVLILPTPV